MAVANCNNEFADGKKLGKNREGMKQAGDKSGLNPHSVLDKKERERNRYFCFYLPIVLFIFYFSRLSFVDNHRSCLSFSLSLSLSPIFYI